MDENPAPERPAGRAIRLQKAENRQEDPEKEVLVLNSKKTKKIQVKKIAFSHRLN